MLFIIRIFNSQLKLKTYNRLMHKIIQYFCVISLLVLLVSKERIYAQGPYQVGTTAANFLEIGFGPAANAMGDAYVSMPENLSAVYWNPAGLAFMRHGEAMFIVQPWILDVQSSFAAISYPVENIGTFAISIVHMGYGDMEVTSLRRQEGTGEIFNANEFALTLDYGRAITEWFAFGAGLKYVSSQIWHETGSAMAFDLGVLIKTEFFSPSGKQNDGLRIGMSISNYGTKLRYDGKDLLTPIDISPGENGNYRDAQGQLKLDSWELPLIFRVGVSLKPLIAGNQSITLAADALHPNNNAESINTGLEYAIRVPTFGTFFLRGGYKALFMQDAEYGPTFGAGFRMNLIRNTSFNLDYAYRDIGVLGKINSFGIAIGF